MSDKQRTDMRSKDIQADMRAKDIRSTDSHLRLDDLAVGYRKKVLIGGIELSVRRGEIVTLIGPNGSGKSTILKTITRQLVPIGGGIYLASKGSGSDHSMKKLTQFTPMELAREMAVVLTGRLQTQQMTCRDVVSMGRYPYTGRLGLLSKEDERKVEEALAAVNALELSERPFEAVSDGERQRVLLARAICQEPEIIVLDEPTSYLDIRHKLELLSILYRMSREQGITVVLSLHEVDLAMKISDRVICVRSGEIFACGKPSEVLDAEIVQALYELDPELGRFDVRTGSLELHFAGSGAPRETAEDLKDDSITLPRLMITAPGSGSGKTLITCGLLRLLKRHAMKPAAFKCGPDYIDPMFHTRVLGIPSRNLDTFFSPPIPQGTSGDACTAASGCGNTACENTVCENTVCGIMARAASGVCADIAVIEGVMGYFDGTGESGMQASSFDLAAQTGTPAVLVVNARGMGRSVVPLIRGFAEYGKDAPGSDHAHRPMCGKTAGIRGVILNRISAGMYPRMKAWIEKDTDVKVIGFVPQDESFAWGSRHLGLLRPEEIGGLQKKIDRLADLMEETIDTEALLALARSAGPMPKAAREAEAAKPGEKLSASEAAQRLEKMLRPPRIAVARDEAFEFYYEDNLELLEECGAEIVYFSPLHDRTFPEADGLVAGGGYPELYAGELSENEEMMAQIRARAAAGMPILAECGGFMYLQEYLEVRERGEDYKGDQKAPETLQRYRMCGVLPGTCRMTDRLVRFGYLELEMKDGENGTEGYLPEGYLMKGHRIRGHEFHYFDSTDAGDACTARKPGGQRSWDCMAVQGNIMAGFPHLYYRSDPAFAQRFVSACAAWGERSE